MSKHLAGVLAALFVVAPPVIAKPDRLPEPGPPFVEPADQAIDYLIVTDGAMRHEFEKLAKLRERGGLRAAVRTLDQIRIAHPAAADDAERIRLFLKDAHRERGTRWVLLGGNASVIPIRRATLRTGFSEILLPTDQYYACLDGTWNADGDSLWGESPSDDVDLIPELFVGRAPVGDRRQARRFVHRTMAWERSLERGAGGTALLAAEEFDFGLDGARVAERIRAMLEAGPVRHVARLYERHDLWPGSFPETREALLDSVDAGYHLALLVGAGGPGLFLAGRHPQDLVSAADLEALSNHPRYSHVYALSAFTNDPDSPSIGSALMSAPRGGAVSVLGVTGLQFTTTAERFAETFFSVAYTEGVSAVGEALAGAIARTAAAIPGDVARMTFQGMSLLGDPASRLYAPVEPGLAYPAAEPELQVAGAFPQTPRLDLLPPRPNPARAAAEIEFQISPELAGQLLRLTVYDLAGRIVRVLESGIARPGSFRARWNLRTEGGAPVEPGLYFARLLVGGESRGCKIVIAR